MHAPSPELFMQLSKTGKYFPLTVVIIAGEEFTWKVAPWNDDFNDFHSAAYSLYLDMSIANKKAQLDTLNSVIRRE